MGTSTSKFLSDVGSVIGGVVAAPFKSVFGRSCGDICGGIWDVVCFIEHICVLDLIRFLLACCLCYVCLVFLYLVYKLGLCQCIARSLCKMCWATCETYWFTLDYVCCYCWYKIRYTRRVYRGRQRLRRRINRDVELGYVSSSSTSGDGDFYDECGSNFSRKRKSRREGRRRRRRRRRMNSGNSVRLRRGQVSVHFKGRSRRGRRRVPSKHFQSSRSSLGRNSRRGRRMGQSKCYESSSGSLDRSKRVESSNFKRPRLSHSYDHES